MPVKATLKKILFGASAAVVLAGSITWFATGANRGWTQTEITVTKHDPVTEIDYPETHKGFLPGLDFLGAAVFAGAVLSGFAILVGRGGAKGRTA